MMSFIRERLRSSWIGVDEQLGQVCGGSQGVSKGLRLDRVLFLKLLFCFLLLAITLEEGILTLLNFLNGSL
jgi:hypothetical protein